MVKIKWKELSLWVFVTLFIGFLGSVISGAMKGYEGINKPAFTPPDITFMIVWIVLYILMGISAYIVYQSDSEYKKTALVIYGISLLINILWPLFFFKFHLFFFSFIWIILLAVVVAVMIYLFYKVRPLAAYLQIPYLLWLIFAAVLNYGVYVLN